MKTRNIMMAILLGMMALCGQVGSARADWAPGDWVEGSPKWWWKYVYPGGLPEGGSGPSWLKIVDIQFDGPHVSPAAAGAEHFIIAVKLQNRSQETYRGGHRLFIKAFCDPNDPQPWRPFNLTEVVTPMLRPGEVFQFRAIAPTTNRAGMNYLLTLTFEGVHDLMRLFGCFVLEGCLNPAQNMQFQFLMPDGTVGYTTAARLDADFNFILPYIPAGFPQVALKGDKWLQKVVPVSGDEMNLRFLAGDMNNDNSADVFDLDLLIQAFNTTREDRSYNEKADLTCDGSVDIFDLGLLIQNFNTTGEG
jgi:hypothetical protein